MIAYTRVSTAEQRKKGNGMAAQRKVLEARFEAEGWDMVPLADDGFSARTSARPGIQEALRMLRAGEAEGIVVAKLDRLTRSLLDFSTLMAEGQRRGWRIVALDLGVDTGTSTGRLVANIMASLAEWERERISERTSEGIRAARDAGKRVGFDGAPSELRGRILSMRGEGLSLQQIATLLNTEGVPTVQGGALWRKSSVASILR